MPLPTPHKGEKKDDFIQRCMKDKTALDDFPDEKQRLAVCFKQEKIRGQGTDKLNLEGTVTFHFDPPEPATRDEGTGDAATNKD